jgi:hypothetical protein
MTEDIQQEPIVSLTPEQAGDVVGGQLATPMMLEIVPTLNIGSQSTGSGAGKISFNPFSITRKIP